MTWTETPSRVFTPLLGMTAVILMAWFLSTLMFRVVHLANFWTLLSVPQFILETVAFLPGILLPKLRMMLSVEYSVRFVPSWIWYAVLIVEVLLPGKALVNVADMFTRLWQLVQWRRGDTPQSRPPLSWIDVGVRVTLLLGLVALLVKILLTPRSLDTSSFQKMAWTLSGFVGLMAVVLLLGIRYVRLPTKRARS